MQKRKSHFVEVEGKLVSKALLGEMFACDIARCKGACCVEGDLGAPLAEDELEILENIYPKVKPYLNKAGKKAIAEQGTSVLDFTRNFSTPLVNGKECAYTIFENGIAFCGIEKAWEAGEVDFKKPISCHLYPIRTHTRNGVEKLNYDRWTICSPACARGENEGIKVYAFLKDAIIRKYGEAFFDALEAVEKALPDNN